METLTKLFTNSKQYFINVASFGSKWV